MPSVTQASTVETPATSAAVNSKTTDNGKVPTANKNAGIPASEIKAANKLAKEVALTPRPILYPNVACTIRSSGVEGSKGPITADLMRQILGWQTEEDYSLMLASPTPTKWGSRPTDPNAKIVMVTFGKDYLCKDEDGKAVRCLHNTNNRPFEEGRSRYLQQIIENRQWAGPLTMPGETINGMVGILIGRTGEVLSGQHTGVGLIRADQKYQKDPSLVPAWTERPVIETMIFTGVSESRDVLMTIDDIKPRSEADVFYTSGLFANVKPAIRAEWCRMFAVAADLLWARTGTAGYRTHPEIVAFVDRHKTLLKCVKHLMEENTGEGRAISALDLSPGQCAALCYLMGSSSSDEAAYRGDGSVPPSEKKLTFSDLVKANEFFSFLAASTDKTDKGGFHLVRKAIADLASEETEGVGDRLKKFAILSRAWKAYLDGRQITKVDCTLHFIESESGRKSLAQDDLSDFGGIDLGDKPAIDAGEKVDPEAPSEEEIEAFAAEELAKRDKADTKAKRDAQAAKIIEQRKKAPTPTKPAAPKIVKPAAKPAAAK